MRYIDVANSLELSLATETMEPYRTQREKGTLPRGLKLIPESEMASLLADLRSEQFWEYAAELSPDNPELRSKSKQLLVLETPGKVLTFPFLSNPGRDPALGRRVASFIHIKQRLTQVFEQTTQFAGVR